MDPRKGSVTAICGPKFSGKTERLISHLNKWRANPYTKTCLVKYCSDTGRNFDTVTTHGGITRKADLIAESMEQIVRHTEVNDVDVLAIDEAQSFRNLRANTELLAQNGVKVFLAGLDATFANHPAPGGLNEMARLLPRAEVIEKQLAMCYFCQKGAGFYFRRDPNFSHGQCDLKGGTDKFAATCRECYEDNKDSIANGLHCPHVLHSLETSFGSDHETEQTRNKALEATGGTFVSKTERTGTQTKIAGPGNANLVRQEETRTPAIVRQPSLVFVNPSNESKTTNKAETSTARPDFSRINFSKIGKWAPWNPNQRMTGYKKEDENENRTG